MASNSQSSYSYQKIGALGVDRVDVGEVNNSSTDNSAPTDGTTANNSPTVREEVFADDDRAAVTLRNFIWMSVFFSANHGCVVACLSLATARLGSTGAWQSGILYLFYTASAVLGATYVVKQLGARNALIAGMVLYCAYVGCFLVATIAPPVFEAPAALLGAAIGGIGAGFLWTAQGSYFGRAAEEHAAFLQQSVSTSNATMASIFAFIYLAAEVLLRALSTILLEFGLAWSVVFGCYTAVAVVSTMLMVLVHNYTTPYYDNDDHDHDNIRHNHEHHHDTDVDIDDDNVDAPAAYGASMNHEGQESLSRPTTFTTVATTTTTTSNTSSAWYKVTAAWQLLRYDPKMKHMVGFNAVFGLTAAFLNSYVNGEVVSAVTHDDKSTRVGIFNAWVSCVAAAMSLVFGKISSHVGGNGLILILGSLCFLGVVLPFLVWPDTSNWGVPLLFLVYTFHGTGRATFEGTLKATFADYFSYEKEGAFANIILQNGLSGAFGYMLTFTLLCSKESRYCIQYSNGSLHDVWSFEVLVVVTAIIAILGYVRASALHQVELEEAARRDAESDVMIPIAAPVAVASGHVDSD